MLVAEDTPAAWRHGTRTWQVLRTDRLADAPGAVVYAGPSEDDALSLAGMLAARGVPVTVVVPWRGA